MAERDTCLVITAATWLEVIGGAEPLDSGLARYEFKIRCHVIGESPVTVMVDIHELADAAGRFRPLAGGPQLRSIPRNKIIREELWERG